jgi:hypothetical protein
MTQAYITKTGGDMPAYTQEIKTDKKGYPIKPAQFNWNPSARLAYYRAISDYSNNTQSWRTKRYTKPTILHRSSLTRSKYEPEFYLDDFDQFPGYQNHEDGHKIPYTGRDYPQGWYTNDFGDTCIPVVVTIRRQNRLNSEYDGESPAHIFYMPGYRFSDWDGVTIIDELHDTPQEAARSANYEAEKVAEQYRLDDEKYYCEQQIEEATAEIHTINKTCLALIREAKNQLDIFSPAVCQAIRDQITDYLNDRAEAFKTIAENNDKLRYL